MVHPKAARLLPLALLLAAPADALAGAGGGSSGYGGGGGGGGYSGGGGSGGSGSGEPPPLWLILLIVGGLTMFFIFSAITSARLRRKRRLRIERARAAAAEASEDDPHFAPDAVTTGAAQLFKDCQRAWSEDDRATLERLVGDDLMVEWKRRLDDFAKKGWRNEVDVKHGPTVEYVGLVNREDDTADRVVVRIQATMRDVVRTKNGTIIKKKDSSSETVAVAEYWTLARRGDGWCVVSIEQDSEGAHHLDAPLLPSPWSDLQGLRDEAIVEQAVADAAPADVKVAELVDLDFADDARAAALDLSLVDDRFSPNVLEAAARRAVAGWSEAVDGDDGALEAVATPEAIQALLYPQGPGRRLVVRGPQLRSLRIVALDGQADPPRFTVEAEVTGRRYVENRDTLQLLEGSRDDATTFTERWILALDRTAEVPWRLAQVDALSARA